MTHHTINVSKEVIEKFRLVKIELQSLNKREYTNNEILNLLMSSWLYQKMDMKKNE